MEPSTLKLTSRSEDLTLCIPSAVNCNEDARQNLAVSIQRIYNVCLSNQKQIEGDLMLSFVVDVSKKNIQIKNAKGEAVVVNKVITSSYIDGNSCTALKWVFCFPETKETYVTPRMDDCLPSVIFDGMEYERIFPVKSVFPIPPKEFWDDWEEQIPQEAMHYDRVIYPKIIETVRKIQIRQSKMLDVLDIGGGSGSLAVSLLKDLPKKIRHITVIDGSAKLLEQAEIKGKVYKGKLTTQCVDLTSPQTLTKLALSADLIILCGVVAHKVLQKDIGKKVIETCLPILRENGFLIAASLSPALINSEEYESLGYTVYNKSFTFRINRGPMQLPYATNDFYILQKK